MVLKGGNRAKGAKGEKIAVRYLKKHGYKILERNFRNPFGEVDIIAFKEGVTVFAEVKTRFTYDFGSPAEAVGSDRRRRYLKAAKFYFAGREPDCVVRFDIIEVSASGVNHIISAFGEN